ncbi:MAG: DUF2202 domain-containing protein [Clostridiaceae bacterium]|nr:DUF2202 domain-containing protein [Clostridiaceae bacterium]
MNKQIKTWAASLLAVAIVGTAGLVMAEENTLGAQAAAKDSSYTLEEMLTYAIQDEYLAQAEYAAIIAAFDVTRPYTNILRAEDNHADALLGLFEAHDMALPDAKSVAGQAVIPETLAETFAIGVEAEQNNIAMYDAFLKQDLPDDVRVVFENLRDASVNHLAAFERGVTRDGTGNRFGGSARQSNRGNSGSRGTRAANGIGQQGDPDNCIIA